MKSSTALPSNKTQDCDFNFLYWSRGNRGYPSGKYFVPPGGMFDILFLVALLRRYSPVISDAFFNWHKFADQSSASRVPTAIIM